MRFTAAILLTLILTAFCLPAHAARPLRAASMPAISADGGTVFFSAWGDIWSVPRDCSAPATRLTDNVAHEDRPIASPDGKWVSFISDRFGNTDLFLMPVTGGAARRLTYADTYDQQYGWRADSGAIIEYTLRPGDVWSYAAYEVPLDGSQPRRLTGPDHDDHVHAGYLGDGEHIVYSRGPGNWAQKHANGWRNYDIWIVSTETGEHTQLTEHDGKDLWPQPSPGGDRIYFVSDRDGTENLWELTVATRELRQLTFFDGDGTRWPRISPDGSEIACTVFGEIYIVDTASGATDKLDITFPADHKHEMVYEDDFFNSVSEFALSPNGNYFAAVYMGDIYLLKNPDRYDETPDQNLARARKLVSSPGHEKELSWHHGSTQLAYVSDRDGQFELYTLDLTTMEEERLTYTPVEESAPQFDPVGDLICYYSGNREMRLMDTATGEDELLREGTFRWGPWVQGFAWAPDGYWLAYCEDFLDYQQEIFLINIEDKEPVNITRNPDWNGGVMFSPDGKWLAYTYSGETYTDVMLLPLDPEAAVYDTELLFAEDLPQPEDEDSAAEDEAADETAEPEDAEAGEAEDTVEPISIDFERIDERDYRAVRMNGDSYFYGFDPASSYLLFANDRMGYPQLWSYGLEDGSTSQLDGAVSDYYYFAPDGSRLYYLQGGRVAYLNMRGQDAAGGGSVDMLCEYGFDQYAIWEQVLREGWRVLDQGFYDGRMAGIDWEDVLARYYPLVREVGTPVEFGQLYREMLGELGRSHLSYYGYGNTREAPADTTGALGVDWAGDYDGPGWEVARVLPFTPADEPGSELYTGDIVLAINGEDLPRRANRGYWLRNTVGEVLTLTVENGPEAAEVLATAVGETREVEIMPVPSGMLSQVRYDMWVEANREYVYERSNERIGYQHIRKMYGEEADQFRIDLFSESADKDALIIDVRFNTGGYTAVDVMNIIEEQAAYLRKRRDAPEMNAGRAYVWEGPIVVLINAHSFSNAEIFAHIMKDAGLATIIGEPTPGGVISTSQYQLMDGSTISIPSGGNFRINGEDMEGPYKGVEPDILVLIEPEIAEAGGDNQLDAAVDFLLGEIS